MTIFRHVLLDGTNDSISTPDNAAFSALGDFSLVFLFSANDFTPAGQQTVASHLTTTGNQRSWRFFLQTDGTWNLQLSTNGSTSSTATSSAASGYTDGVVRWGLITRATGTGDVKFYTGPVWDGASVAPPAIGSFSQLGTTRTGPTGTLFNSTADLYVSTHSAGASEPFAGKAYRVLLYTGIYGSGSETLVRDCNPNDYTTGTTWVAATTGETWTLNNGAQPDAEVSGVDTGSGADAGESIATTITDADTGAGVDGGESIAIPSAGVDTGSGADAGESIAAAVSGLTFFRLDGVDDRITTPDAAAFSSPTDFSVLYKVALDDWTPAGLQSVLSHQGTGDRAFRSIVNAGGRLQVQVSTDGTSFAGAQADADTGFTDETTHWVLERRNATTGAITYYTAPDVPGSIAPPEFGTFTILGTAQSGPTGAAFNSTLQLVVGANSAANGDFLDGDVYRVMFYSGLYGSGSEALVRDMNARDYSGSGSTFVSATTGETWTISGATFFVGTEDQGTGAESASIAATLTDADTGTASDGGETVAVPVTSDDPGSGTDAGESIAATVSGADTGTGADAGESIAVAISDSDSGVAVDDEDVTIPPPPAAPPARRGISGTALLDLPAGVGQIKLSFRYEILNYDLTYAFTAEAVDRDNPPTIYFDANGDINRTMSGIRFGPRDAERINPLSHLVMPRCELEDGTLINMGVFHFKTVPLTIHTWGDEFRPECYDRSLILVQKRKGSFAIGKDTLYTTAARALIDEVGLTAFAAVDNSSAAAQSPQTFPSGTSRKAILKWICEALGFYPPYFDNDGFLRLRAVPNPISDAPPDVIYTADENSRIIHDSISAESNIGDAPNVYRVVGDPFAGAEVIGEFFVPATAPHSVAHRGFEIADEVSNQNVHDKPAADAAAHQRYVMDYSTFVRVDFETSIDPRADGMLLSRFLGTNYREQSWSMECRPGGRMTHSAQEVWQP